MGDAVAVGMGVDSSVATAAVAVDGEAVNVGNAVSVGVTVQVGSGVGLQGVPGVGVADVSVIGGETAIGTTAVYP